MLPHLRVILFVGLAWFCRTMPNPALVPSAFVALSSSPQSIFFAFKTASEADIGATRNFWKKNRAKNDFLWYHSSISEA